MFNFKFLTALKAIGWSQRELARQTGITEARISNIMNKKWNPSQEEKRKIEEVLNKKIWR